MAAGDTVELKLGESAAITGSEAVIRFSEIIADTRCPLDVVCVWAGDAQVRLDVLTAGTVRVRAKLHTGMEPRAVQYESLGLELVAVTPVPTATRRTPPHEYAIRILVSRS